MARLGGSLHTACWESGGGPPGLLVPGLSGPLTLPCFHNQPQALPTAEVQPFSRTVSPAHTLLHLGASLPTAPQSLEATGLAACAVSLVQSRRPSFSSPTELLAALLVLGMVTDWGKASFLPEKLH